jgi:phenylalanyl-tRNA synthetase beta subunit
MQLRAEHSVFDDNKCNINVLIPPTRSDVLHPCDVMEVITAMVTIILSLEYSQFAFFLFANDKTSFYLFIYLFFSRMLQLHMGIMTFRREGCHP